MNKETSTHIPKQSSLNLFLRFLRFGCLAFGGPVAQIAMIKKELVEQEKWISREQFNRALAVYQVLPGPEAHELCVYFGMKAKGRWGGFLAGLGFMLPGLILMLLLTWFYVKYGIQSSFARTIFGGIQAAVVALIGFAVYRIGKHSIINVKLMIIAACCGISFFLGVNFLIILAVAGASHALWNKSIAIPLLFAISLIGITVYTVYQKGLTIETAPPQHPSVKHPKARSAGDVFITGLKGGLLSFGGAYTAIPIIQEDAVIKKQWMSQDQFLDGIALSGILPAPLIIFSTFVGYFGGGWPGSLIITLGIFLPAFSFTLIGHSIMEKIIANQPLHQFLDGVTAGVIGLIAATAIKVFITTITSLPAFIIFLLAILLLVRFRSKYTVLLVICGAGFLNMAWDFIK